MKGFSCFHWTVIAAAALLAGCPDGGYLIVERDDEGRRVGEACVLDSQCDDGRCVAGVCSDGSCAHDDDCAAGEICVFEECQPADDFACTPTQQPLITLSSTALDFGEVALGNTGTQT